MRRTLLLLAQEEGAVGAAEGQYLVGLDLFFQIAGHRAARQQTDEEFQLGQAGGGAGWRVAAQHLEARHLDLHELAGAEVQRVAFGQLQGQAHHVAGDALGRIDEGVHFSGRAGADFAAVGQFEGAVRLRLAKAQQALAGGVFAGEQGRAGAGPGMRFTLGELGDAAGAAAGAALV
ncbi:hypothetical protein D3C78_1059500 [compost metagenome]